MPALDAIVAAMLREMERRVWRTSRCPACGADLHERRCPFCENCEERES